MNVPPERLDHARASAESNADADADQMALELMMRLAGRLMVARSFARIAGGLLQESASVALKARVLPVARAAVAAAVHVATTRVPHGAPPDGVKSPRKNREDRAPVEDDEDEAPSSLDHEALHDDAC